MFVPAKVIGCPLFAVLVRVNVCFLGLPTFTLPKFLLDGEIFRISGTTDGVDVGVAVMVGVGVAVAVLVAVAVGVAVAVAPVEVALAVGVADLVGVALIVAVGVALRVAVAVIVGVAVGPVETFNDTVSIAKSAQSPAQLEAGDTGIVLNTTLLMLGPVLSSTPIKMASPLASLFSVNVPREVPPLNA